jgi:hypothetical protein
MEASIDNEIRCKEQRSRLGNLQERSNNEAIRTTTTSSIQKGKIVLVRQERGGGNKKGSMKKQRDRTKQKSKCNKRAN